MIIKEDKLKKCFPGNDSTAHKLFLHGEKYNTITASVCFLKFPLIRVRAVSLLNPLSLSASSGLIPVWFKQSGQKTEHQDSTPTLTHFVGLAVPPVG